MPTFKIFIFKWLVHLFQYFKFGQKGKICIYLEQRVLLVNIYVNTQYLNTAPMITKSGRKLPGNILHKIGQTLEDLIHFPIQDFNRLSSGHSFCVFVNFTNFTSTCYAIVKCDQKFKEKLNATVFSF